MRSFGKGLMAVVLALGSCWLVAGCLKSTGQPGPPSTEPKAEDVGAHVQRGKEIQQAENDLHQLGIFYQAYNAENGRFPKPEELKQYIKRDAPKIYQALQEGRYVAVPNPAPGTDSVLAYEKDADLNGIRLVLVGDGGVQRMNELQFRAALQKKGG